MTENTKETTGSWKNRLNDAVQHLTEEAGDEMFFETAAMLLESGASPELLGEYGRRIAEIRANLAVRGQATHADGWEVVKALFATNHDRDTAWITAAAVTALLACDDRHQQYGYYHAVLDWDTVALAPDEVWGWVSDLRADAVRFGLPSAEDAAKALETALRRELPSWWCVSFVAGKCDHDSVFLEILREYDISTVVKAPGVHWVKTRDADEVRVLTSVAVHWADEVTVELLPGWPDGMSITSTGSVVPSRRWGKNCLLQYNFDGDPCRQWFVKDSGDRREAVPKVTDKDPLYEKALKCVKDTGLTSTRFLQRTFGIGSQRASALIMMLEKEGVVSESNERGYHRLL